MAYIFVRMATLNPTAVSDETLAWIPKVGRAAGQAIGRDVNVLMPVTGNKYNVLWTVSYETMAQIEQADRAMAQDAEYNALVGEARSRHYIRELQDVIYEVAP